MNTDGHDPGCPDDDDASLDDHALFDNPAAIRRLDMRGYRDITAGRLLGNEAVTVWLGMWSQTGDEAPRCR
ncbi:hypothetical protein [Sphingomonas beigongshangi]|uniref:hypothetical protein n=1 Tax=Sphingomonas beigongshangi TaxID=2782540 RepID=UPI00193C780C|nr:hypothetical protein [Sphingomonas beigongshangi]